jgi:acetylornithine deacetylase/succinyl-diaminopimelate desuccinylase-like protein
MTNVIQRIPNLGIEGAFSGCGAKTVIPRRVVGKFSIRTVPNMTIEDTSAKVIQYCEQVHKQRGSPNKL